MYLDIYPVLIFLLCFLQPPQNTTVFSISEDSGSAREFFMVNRMTGEVSLKRSLLDGESDRYEVRSCQIGFNQYM